MEDKPAGKVTPTNPPVDSPKKASNPIGIESQWSLGWNGGTKDIFNRPNNSKGTPTNIKVLICTTTKAAYSSETPRPANGKRKNPSKAQT